jgi:multiple sugar transport system substrate-binding protein
VTNSITEPRRALGARRWSRRAFLGAVGGAMAGACAPVGRGAGSGSGRKVDLVYQDWRTLWFPALAREMLDVFHRAHPHIRVYYTPDPERLDEQMTADFQAGVAPDVLAGCCDFLPTWAQSGHLLDLRPFVEADLERELIQDWDEAQYRALFLPDGSQFALPKYHGALGLLYNKDLFDAAGLDHPDGSWTYEDYDTALRRLTVPARAEGEESVWGGMVDINWERLQVHANAWGGHFVDPEDSTKSHLARPESLAALGWLRDRMWTEHTLAGPLDVHNRSPRKAFARGQLATVEEGSWALREILEEAGFRVGVAPMPAGPVRRATLATTDGFAIYAGTRHPEAAWELLKFLVGQDYGRAMARTHLLQPARASLVPDWVRLVREAFPRQAAEMDLGAFADGHLAGYSVTAEVFADMAPARQLAREAWQRIFVLGQAPVSILGEVSAAIERAQQEAGPA